MQWMDIVPYDEAVRLVSTYGDNGRAYLDKLSAAACQSRAHGAWLCNDRDSYVAHRSAAFHKRQAAAQ